MILHANAARLLQLEAIGKAGHATLALAIVIALRAAPGVGEAAEINAFISTAIKAVTDELLPPFERANSHSIRAAYAPSGALIPRFDRGEPVDVFLTDSTAIDGLITLGKIVPGRTDLARTGIGIAVRKGAHKPDVSSAPRRSSARCSPRRSDRATPRPPAAASPRRISCGCSETLRHRRRGHAQGQARRRRSRTAASACWCRAGRRRSGCSRSPSCGSKSRGRGRRHARRRRPRSPDHHRDEAAFDELVRR